MLYYYIHFSLANPENLPGLIFEILILIRRVVAWMYLCSISSAPIRFMSVKVAFENWGDLLKNPRLSLLRGRTAIWLKNVQFFFSRCVHSHPKLWTDPPTKFQKYWLMRKYLLKVRERTWFSLYSTPFKTGDST